MRFRDYSIRQKVGAVLILPLLGFLYFTAVRITEDYSVNGQASRAATLVKMSGITGDLIHQIQKERGLSSGFISNEGHNFGDELAAQLKETDKIVSEFENQVRGFDFSRASAKYSELFTSAKGGIAKVAEMRQKVRALKATGDEAVGFYTSLVNTLMEIPLEGSRLITDPELSGLARAHGLFIRGKEMMGRQRAILVNVFTNDSMDSGDYRKFTANMATRDSYFGMFFFFAGDEGRKVFDSKLKGSVAEEVDRIEKFIIHKGDRKDSSGFNITPEHWVKTATAHIESMMEVEDILHETISGKADEIASSAKISLMLVSVMALALLGVMIAGYVVAERILKNLDGITSSAQKIAVGDTATEVTYHSGDEVGQLAEAFRNLLKAQKNEIRVINAMALGDFSNDVEARSEKDELSRSLQRMADDTNKVVRLASAMAGGDLTVDVAMRSDKDEMSRALDSMVEQLNVILGEVNRAVSQVTAGSTQISQASQSLSSGATESAASLEEITASIGQIGSQARGNAENASQANGLAVSARSSAEKGNGAVTEMLAAMKAVQDSGQQIAKVVKMIDDIAFQTNILSLNAAVEAARAGRHGRGFAVVADAVRNLANRSANAAKDTAELVDSTIKRIQESHQIASRTADSLGEIVTNSVKVADLVGEIAAASNEQAQGVSQINQGLTQINQVTQQNTANAEETAAAAEELSTQSVELQRLMSRFKLKMNGHGAMYVTNQPHARILETPNGGGKQAMINAAKSGKLLDARRLQAKADWV